MQGCVISCGTVVFSQKLRNLSRLLLTNNNFYSEMHLNENSNDTVVKCQILSEENTKHFRYSKQQIQTIENIMKILFDLKSDKIY